MQFVLSARCWSNGIIAIGFSIAIAANMFVNSAIAQSNSSVVVPLPAAHAHNDYLHRRPLLDALDNGFCSVEADVFLIDNELLVAHYRWATRKDRTLQTLYLDPLAQRVKQNGGRVYRDGPVFTLLIDFKQDGAAIYERLDEQLANYPDVFSVVKDGTFTQKAVNVIISGDRPVELIAADTERFAGIDGRLSDLDSDVPVHLMPLISDRWGSHFQWRGRDEMSEAEQQKLAKIVEKVHEKGRILRFWAIPDTPTSWKLMQNAGIDLINTDNLKGLSEQLKE